MLAGLPAKLFSSEERILLRMPSLVRFGVEKTDQIIAPVLAVLLNSQTGQFHLGQRIF